MVPPQAGCLALTRSGEVIQYFTIQTKLRPTADTSAVLSYAILSDVTQRLESIPFSFLSKRPVMDPLSLASSFLLFLGSKFRRQSTLPQRRLSQDYTACDTEHKTSRQRRCPTSASFL